MFYGKSFLKEPFTKRFIKSEGSTLSKPSVNITFLKNFLFIPDIQQPRSVAVNHTGETFLRKSFTKKRLLSAANIMFIAP
jgi:hypothetical protein